MRGNDGSVNLRGKRGFYLIAVLIISMVGMAMVGGMLYSFQTFTGGARVVFSDTAVNNILEDGVEKGRAILKARMNNTDPPPRWMDKDGLDADSPIPDVDTLLLDDGIVYEADLSGRDLAGKTGSVRVEIFDMQYDPAKNEVQITDQEELMRLPHSFMIKGSYEDWIQRNPKSEGGEVTGTSGASPVNAGAYLIRATLEIESGVDREVKTLETAVVQTNLLPPSS